MRGVPANRVGDIHVEVNVLDGQRTNLTKAATGIKQQTDYRGIAHLDELAALAVIEQVRESIVGAAGVEPATSRL